MFITNINSKSLLLSYYHLNCLKENNILQNSCPAIGAFGKLTQIYEIVRTNRGDLVSKLPFITNALTSSGIEFTLFCLNFVKTNFYLFSPTYYSLDGNSGHKSLY